jgi:ABC-type antimicrobial peptide transport system permease subunit
MFESLKSDFRSAFSTLRHRPGVAAAVILTLSLGIAANTAVFSVVDAVLLKPLPYLKEGSILFGLGAALGWMGALAASGLFSGLLYGIEPTDTTSYVAVTGALSVVALAAALVPALRASRTDPWSSLRAE